MNLIIRKIDEPKDFLRIFIRNMFIGNTIADKKEIVIIRINPNSVPEGMWLTT